MKEITVSKVQNFKSRLQAEEKSSLTVEKYLRDIAVFSKWLGNKALSKENVLKFKEFLIKEYTPASVNSMLSSINSFFVFNGWHDLKVKALKIQRQIFISKEKELTKAEYQRLLKAAKEKGNERLCLLMQTICSSGLRVSELKFITVESVKSCQAEIKCKGKKMKKVIGGEATMLLLFWV